MLDELGLLHKFLKKGIRVDKGIAHSGRKKLGEINFASTQHSGQKHPYILIHPQNETEALLKEALSERLSHSIRYGSEVTGFRDNGNHIVVFSHKIPPSPDTPISERQENRCPILIACDGKNSALEV